MAARRARSWISGHYDRLLISEASQSDRVGTTALAGVSESIRPGTLATVPLSGRRPISQAFLARGRVYNGAGVPPRATLLAPHVPILVGLARLSVQ
jgi:hypothetical protein